MLKEGLVYELFYSYSEQSLSPMIPETLWNYELTWSGGDAKCR